MGFDHLGIYDHVLGADPKNRPGWTRYTHENAFHEPFVTLGYVAAVTQRIELETSCIVLPQRQAALVAKQAAELDFLSNGRFRFGVSVGWNDVEYEGLGQDFHTRGARIEEQIDLIKKLWAEPVITYKGKHHTVTEAGINPLPTHPIPLWMGGSSDPVLKRAAKLADGWFPQGAPDDERKALVEKFKGYVKDAGRDISTIGIEARTNVSKGAPDMFRTAATQWQEIGATHISFTTEGGGFRTVDEHLRALKQALDACHGLQDIKGNNP
jgi:probable F420-dependent oxidoreductase